MAYYLHQEVIFSLLFVCCLSFSNFAQKPQNGLVWNFQKVGNRPVNKWLNFAGDPDRSLDTGIVFQIRHSLGDMESG